MDRSRPVPSTRRAHIGAARLGTSQHYFSSKHTKSMNILMLATENAALPAAKVGGIGDVLRDLPPSLARQGYQVSVVILMLASNTPRV